MAGIAKDGGGRRVSRWRLAAWAAAALVLLLPLVAMQSFGVWPISLFLVPCSWALASPLS